MWFEGEIRDGFQPLSLFLESSIQAPDSSIWGLLTRMPFNAGLFLSPPCLESWGDEVGLPCWVPIAGCFSVEFLIHSRTFPFILLWSFSLNFVILEFLLWHSAYLPLFSQRTHQCSPLPLPQTNLLFIYSLGTFDDSAPPWVRVPLTPFIHQGRDSWFTLMLEFSSETPDCTKGISSSLTQGTRHPIPALGHKHFVSSQSWLMPSPHLCYKHHPLFPAEFRPSPSQRGLWTVPQRPHIYPPCLPRLQPYFLERAKAARSFLPLPVAYTLYRCPFSTWISAVNWKTWETSKVIFMFSSSLTEWVQEEAPILKKEVFSTLPVKISCPYTSSPLLPFLQISKCPLLPAASISFLLVPSPVSWHAQINSVFKRNKNFLSSAS